MRLLDKIKAGIRSFDNVYRYTDGTWIYNVFDNPFSGSFSPDGRYVFHSPKAQIPFLEETLAQKVKSREIRAFKYAIQPLPDEERPAVVVYARKKTKSRIKQVLEDLGIHDLEWRDGNPVSVANLMSKRKELPSTG